MDRSAQAGIHRRPHEGQQCGCLHVIALFPVSLVWTGTYLPCWYAVVKLQVNCEFFAVHLVAQENSANLSPLQKFFYFFLWLYAIILSSSQPKFLNFRLVGGERLLYITDIVLVNA